MSANFYTHDERLKIVQYIIKHDGYYLLRGNTLWKNMEDSGILNRTWQSMKQHFKMKIIENLQIYNITKDQQKRIYNGYNTTRVTKTGSNNKHNRTPPDNLCIDLDFSDTEEILEKQNNSNKNKRSFNRSPSSSSSSSIDLSVSPKRLRSNVTSNSEPLLNSTEKSANNVKKFKKQVLTYKQGENSGLNKNLSSNESQCIVIDSDESNSTTETNCNIIENNQSSIKTDAFSLDEDMEIIKCFTGDNEYFKYVNENVLYKIYSDTHNTRTWQEIKDRFLNYILPNLHKYNYFTVDKLKDIYTAIGMQIPDDIKNQIEDESQWITIKNKSPQKQTNNNNSNSNKIVRSPYFNSNTSIETSINNLDKSRSPVLITTEDKATTDNSTEITNQCLNKNSSIETPKNNLDKSRSPVLITTTDKSTEITDQFLNRNLSIETSKNYLDKSTSPELKDKTIETTDQYLNSNLSIEKSKNYLDKSTSPVLKDKTTETTDQYLNSNLSIEKSKNYLDKATSPLLVTTEDKTTDNSTEITDQYVNSNLSIEKSKNYLDRATSPLLVTTEDKTTDNSTEITDQYLNSNLSIDTSKNYQDRATSPLLVTTEDKTTDNSTEITDQYINSNLSIETSKNYLDKSTSPLLKTTEDKITEVNFTDIIDHASIMIDDVTQIFALNQSPAKNENEIIKLKLYYSISENQIHFVGHQKLIEAKELSKTQESIHKKFDKYLQKYLLEGVSFTDQQMLILLNEMKNYVINSQSESETSSSDIKTENSDDEMKPSINYSEISLPEIKTEVFEDIKNYVTNSEISIPVIKSEIPDPLYIPEIKQENISINDLNIIKTEIKDNSQSFESITSQDINFEDVVEKINENQTEELNESLDLPSTCETFHSCIAESQELKE